MCLRRYLSSKTKPELEELKEQINLTEEEYEIFELLSKNKSIVQISIEICMSERTVCYKIKQIKKKINKIEGGE